MALEQAPHRAVGVSYAPLRLGDLDDPWNGPEIGGEPVGERSLRQEVRKGRQSIARNEGRAARAGHRAKGGHSILIGGDLPKGDGRGGHHEAPGDLGLREPRSKQSKTIQASFLQRFGVPVPLGPSSHAPRDRRGRISSYLFRCQ